MARERTASVVASTRVIRRRTPSRGATRRRTSEAATAEESFSRTTDTASATQLPESHANTASPPAPLSEVDVSVSSTYLAHLGTAQWDMLASLLVFLVCAATRFYRLDYPAGVVFDEFHFGRFTNQYNDRQFLFDIHPPLGKLVFFWVTQAYAYDFTVCDYESDDAEYDPACRYMPLRVTAAIFGSLTAPVIYYIARNWGTSLWGGVLAASLFIFDGINITEDRLILIDSQLLFWCAVALLTAQRWWSRLNEHTLAVDEWFEERGVTYTDSNYGEAKDIRLMTSRERWLWCLAVGVTTSSAVSTKWTTLATPGMIAIESFAALFFLRRSVPWSDLLRIAAIAFALYSHWFYWHFQLGQKTADGDNFMTEEFQRTIPGNERYDPDAPKPLFWPSFFYLNAEMLRANARIDQRHNWDSVWWQWILNVRGILYYSRPAPSREGYFETVYLLGNPVVIWGVGACVALGGISGLAFLRLRTTIDDSRVVDDWSPFFTRVAYCIATYIINLLPYVAVVRSTFLYHYMPALMYGQLLTAMVIDRAAGPRWMPVVSKLVLVAIVSSFIFFSPWIYSFREWYCPHSHQKATRDDDGYRHGTDDELHCATLWGGHLWD